MNRFSLTGHRGTDGHEPRQVRKEAAISDAGLCRGPFPVMQMLVFQNKFDRGCTTFFILQDPDILKNPPKLFPLHGFCLFSLAKSHNYRLDNTLWRLMFL